MVTAFPNIRYLSNHVGSAGILVLTRDDAHLLVDFRYEAAVQALQASAAACPGLRIWPVPASYDEALLGCLVAIGVEDGRVRGGPPDGGALRVAAGAGVGARHGARRFDRRRGSSKKRASSRTSSEQATLREAGAASGAGRRRRGVALCGPA